MKYPYMIYFFILLKNVGVMREIRVCNMHGDSWLPMLSKRCLTGIQLSTVWPSTKHYLASGWASVGYRSVLCWKMPDGAAVFF